MTFLTIPTSSSIHKGIHKMDYKNTFEELFNLKLPLVTSPRKFCKKIYWSLQKYFCFHHINYILWVSQFTLLLTTLVSLQTYWEPGGIAHFIQNHFLEIQHTVDLKISGWLLRQNYIWCFLPKASKTTRPIGGTISVRGWKNGLSDG